MRVTVQVVTIILLLVIITLWLVNAIISFMIDDWWLLLSVYLVFILLCISATSIIICVIVCYSNIDENVTEWINHSDLQAIFVFSIIKFMNWNNYFSQTTIT